MMIEWELERSATFQVIILKKISLQKIKLVSETLLLITYLSNVPLESRAGTQVLCSTVSTVSTVLRTAVYE